MANEDLVGDVTAEQEVLPRDETLSFSNGLSLCEQLFCIRYVELGRNGRQAALAAGYSQAAAGSAAVHLMRRPEIRTRIIELAKPVMRKAKLEMNEMLAQIHAVATFDRRKLYNEDGTRKLFTELDAQTAAAISHMGPNDFVPFDKLKAVDMAMKHLGGFEKDNEQRRENLSIEVTFT